MDCSEVSWLSEMGLDNPFFMDNQCEQAGLMMMEEYSLDEEIAAVLGQDLDTCLSASSTLVHTPSTNSITSLYAAAADDYIVNEPPHKLQKPNNSFSDFSSTIDYNIQSGGALCNNNNSSAPIILNFAENHHRSYQEEEMNPTPPTLNPEEEAAVSEVLMRSDEQPNKAQPIKKPTRVRPPSQTYDHIVAERKRREQLSQRFVALSSIVPGLKKTDKTSVLGDAIKYLKHLQERVKTLEEQSTKHTMESVVLVKKSHVVAEDEGSSDESGELPLPEIEARVCKGQILIRIHCEREKGVLVNLLSKVENLNLSVLNTNVTPFGCMALDVTVVAEMEKEFNLTAKEMVKRLRAALTLKQL